MINLEIFCDKRGVCLVRIRLIWSSCASESLKKIVDVLECQQFPSYGIAPVSPLYHHCGAAKNDAKFCITAALYEFRFPPTISSIWLVTAIHSLWLRMVAVNPSTVWNLKEKNAFQSQSCLSLKYFQPQNLIADTVSPTY